MKYQKNNQPVAIEITEDQYMPTSAQSNMITLACLSFFPLVYFIGKAILMVL